MTNPAHMAKKPMALRCESGISWTIFIHLFILSGKAKYGRPSTTRTSPSRQNSNFIIHTFLFHPLSIPALSGRTPQGLPLPARRTYTPEAQALGRGEAGCFDL